MINGILFVPNCSDFLKRKNCSSDQKKTFEIREFAKKFESTKFIEQFIQTVIGQHNFLFRMHF